MLILFVVSIMNLSGPSDSLSYDDINRMRRGQKPTGKPKDYRGGGGSHRVYMGGWGGMWVINKKRTASQYDDKAVNF